MKPVTNTTELDPLIHSSLVSVDSAGSMLKAVVGMSKGGYLECVEFVCSYSPPHPLNINLNP